MNKIEHEEAELVRQKLSHIPGTAKPPRSKISKKEFAVIKKYSKIGCYIPFFLEYTSETL